MILIEDKGGKEACRSKEDGGEQCYVNSVLINKKIAVLCFLQLLKFEKVKCPYFCIICFLSRVMAIL